MLLKLLKLQTHLGAENLCVAKKPKGFMVAKNSDPMFKNTISHNVKIYYYWCITKLWMIVCVRSK